jgi:MFS family permease
MQLALGDFWASASKLYTSNVIRQTTLPLQMVWFSLSFGSYGLTTWINTLFLAVHLEDVYFNALLFALANLPGNLLTAYLMDRTGRDKLLVGSVLCASASLLSFAAFASTSNETSDSSPPNTYGIVLSACSFQCFTIAAWNTIDVMTSELFPTTVRSTGMGVCAASGRVGAMIAQFVNGALVGRPVRLLVVASVTLAMGAMTPFLLPQHGDMTGLALTENYEQPMESNSSESRYHDYDEGEELEEMSSSRSSKNETTPTVGERNSDAKRDELNAVGLSRRGNTSLIDP